MKFEDSCNEINRFISKSNGSIISLPTGEEYLFNLVNKYSISDLSSFEMKHGIKLPEEYKHFLTKVGASKIYFDEFGLGIEFIPIEQLLDFSNKVFKGMKNPFPNILIIASNIGRGDFISYGIDSESMQYRLATFSHEEDPERWLEENTAWSNLKDWLVKLVETEGEEDTI